MDPVSIFNQSPIKGTFVCHLMLITWALITVDWMPKAFFLYNLMFFISLFWALAHPHNSEPVQLAAIFNLLSILLDLMCIATNYSRYHYQDWFGFSMFLLICNLILRAVTSIVLLRVYNERNDRFGSTSGDTLLTPPGNVGNASGHVATSGGYENLESSPITVTSTGGNPAGSGNNQADPRRANYSNNLNLYQAVPSQIKLTDDNSL